MQVCLENQKERKFGKQKLIKMKLTFEAAISSNVQQARYLNFTHKIFATRKVEDSGPGNRKTEKRKNWATNGGVELGQLELE